MRGVDVREFDVDEIVDHFHCGLSALSQEIIDHFHQSLAQHIVSGKLWSLHLRYDPLQLVIHQSDTLKRWLSQSGDLFPHQNLKGLLGDEQSSTSTGGVANGQTNGLSRQPLDGINERDVVLVDVVEDVIDSRTAKHIVSVAMTRGRTVDDGTVVVTEFGDDVEKHSSAGSSKGLSKLSHLCLCFILHASHFHLELGNGVADVMYQDLVELLGKKGCAQTIGDGSIQRMTGEELRQKPLEKPKGGE